MRSIAIPLLFLTGCTFAPSIDGQSLIGCETDADCPRSGICTGGFCVSEPLSIVALTASPETVDPGDTCTLTAEVSHSQNDDKLTYRWRQALGPRVTFTGQGTNSVRLTTVADYVGSYGIEVEVRNEIDPPVTGLARCNAIDRREAAFVVAGHNGDCSQTDPCGSLSDVDYLDPRPTRVYLGVDEGTTDVWYYGGYWNNEYTDREVHGGYVYPGWQRDLERSRTAFAPWGNDMSVTCSNCIFSGFLVQSIADHTARAIQIGGWDVTIREAVVELSGGRDNVHVTGIDANSGLDIGGTHIEGVTVIARDLTANELLGIELVGEGSTLTDSLVDLTDAVANEKVGVRIDGQSWLSARPHVDRLRVVTGGAVEDAVGMRVACAAPTVWNSIVDTRGGVGESSIGLVVHPWDFACVDGTVIHSSLFIGGEGTQSRGLFLESPGTLSILNSILDAGDGDARVAIEIEQDSLRDDRTYDLSGTVLVLDGGDGSRDDWGMHGINPRPIIDLETLLGCDGCLSSADSAGQVDRASGDFHLTEESTCCAATGIAIDGDGPEEDFDGVARPAVMPAVGPYQP